MRNKQYLMKHSCSMAVVSTMLCYTLSSAKTDVPVFLLSGQSNMSGMQSEVSGLTADQKKTVENVKINLNAEGDRNKLGKWLTLGPGFGPGSNNVGPELFFGRILSDSMPDIKIALIKDAVSGAPLGQTSGYLSPSSNNGTGGKLYTAMMTHIDAALKSFNSAFDTAQYTPRWAGFVWLQGETDAMDQNLTNKYETNLKNLISDIRTKTGTPDLPIILPLIDVQTSWTYNSQIRAADVAMKKQLKNVDTMDTKGLPTNKIHYQAQGHVTIGTVCAQRWIAMKYEPPVPVVYRTMPAGQSNMSLFPANVALFDLSGRKMGAGIMSSWRAVANTPGTPACLIVEPSTMGNGTQRCLRLP